MMRRKKQINQALKKLILEKTADFKWRPDFRAWRQLLFYQESRQDFRLVHFYRYIPDYLNKSILDVGCGMGGLITALRLQGAPKVIGLEFDFAHCQITQLRGERYNFTHKIINGAGELLPFKDTSFDIITCFEVLEHAEDEAKVLREIKRVLKRKGIALITIPNRLAFCDPHYHMYFINWLPRVVVDRLLISLGKQRWIYKDRQKLSEMHYSYFWKFKERLSSLGFDSLDLLQRRFTTPVEVETPWIRPLVTLFKRLGVADLLYVIFATFFLDTFQFLIWKKGINIEYDHLGQNEA